MKLTHKNVPIDELSALLEKWMHGDARRLGLLTSIDGGQVIILVLDPLAGAAELWESQLVSNAYTSLSLRFPELHWSERVMWNMFGIVPNQHPRLKPVLVHEQYEPDFYPLRQVAFKDSDVKAAHTPLQFLEVHGEGVWELPVGPIHAGVIEPGHFRFSCLGEVILNLEIKLGYVHRGVEKRMTQVPWRKSRFVAEASASDTAAAHALAHAIAVETLFDEKIPEAAQVLRTLALEIERAAMHIADVGGMMTDIGLVSMAATMGRLRGYMLNAGQLLSGSRYLRSYILPGGVLSRPAAANLEKLKTSTAELKHKIWPVLQMFRENQAAINRMEGIGKIKKSLAAEFGFVGIAARACGLEYDTRRHFPQGIFPKDAPPPVVETGGDIRSRIEVRITELWHSLDLIEKLAGSVAEGPVQAKLPDKLPANGYSVGIVEAFRGELIHLCVTGADGEIKRYAVKDPSFNNWTAISIAVRDNLIADFPLCNKSLSLSYGGNDL